MLDRGDLFDAQPYRRIGRKVAGPVQHVRRRPDGFASDDDQPAVQRVRVDPDLVQALVDLEGDRLAVVLECGPARRTRALLKAGAAVNERAVRVVLERLLGVDPARDRDRARRFVCETSPVGYPREYKGAGDLTARVADRLRILEIEGVGEAAA